MAHARRDAGLCLVVAVLVDNDIDTDIDIDKEEDERTMICFYLSWKVLVGWLVVSDILLHSTVIHSSLVLLLMYVDGSIFEKNEHR